MAQKKDSKKDTQARNQKMASTKPIFDQFGIGPEDAQRIMRDFYHEMQQAQDDLELIETLKKPTLTPEEIWAIKPATFYTWRVKYDFPRILEHFSKKLERFDEWKSEFEIDNNFLIHFGISNCINTSEGKSKFKYVFYLKGGNPNQAFLSASDLTKKVRIMWGEEEKFELKKKFTGYLDWCNLHGIKAYKDQNLLKFFSATSYHSPEVKMSILDGLELLKVGGIEINPNAAGLINVKYFEFVNASFLKFKGRIATAGLVLKFVNSFVNHLEADELDFPLVEFENSEVQNIHFVNSNIQQWSFYKTLVTGKISNSRLSMIDIRGGGFHPILDNTVIENINATHINELNFKSTYQSLKKTFADQGDDKNAIYYFLKEKEMERITLWKSLFNQKINSHFKINFFKKAFIYTKSTLYLSYLYLSSVLNNAYWGYGRKPFRIIFISFVVIILCAFLYQFNQELMNKPGHQAHMNFSDSFYFSSVTFTTLGYGDFTPNGFLRIVTAFEAIFGGMSIGFLVAGFANLKY